MLPKGWFERSGRSTRQSMYDWAKVSTKSLVLGGKNEEKAVEHDKEATKIDFKEKLQHCFFIQL